MEAPAAEVNGAAARRRAEAWAVALLFVSCFLAVLLTTNDYGPTYDEPHYVSAGVRYAEWWVRALRSPGEALKREAIAETWGLNHEHPPLQKMKSGFSQRWFGGILPGLMAARLPSAAWFGLAACAIYLFVRRRWGVGSGLFGALAFVTMPRVAAHAHLVALDMPITAWFFVAAALMAEAMRRRSWGWAAVAGAAFGVALSAKVNAFFLPMLLIPWALIWHRREWPKLVVALALIGPVVFFALWPWLWIAPAAHFREYLAFHFRHAAYNVWYLGKLYQYAPWHYPFVVTAVTTPAVLLGLAVAGLARCRPRRGWTAEEGLLALGLVVTLAPSALPSSPKYNGERLFLPAFAFVAALAGVGFGWIEGHIAARNRARRDGQRIAMWLTALAAVALLMPSARATAMIHPYGLAYYNALVGGVRGAAKRGFETVYWGQVYKEAPPFLNAAPEMRPRVLVVPKGCIYLLELQQQAGALRPDVQFTAEEAEAGSVDYVVFQCMQSDFTELCWRLYRSAEPAYEVALEGTPLLVIYDREAVAGVMRERARSAPASAQTERREMKRPTRNAAGS